MVIEMKSAGIIFENFYGIPVHQIYRQKMFKFSRKIR